MKTLYALVLVAAALLVPVVAPAVLFTFDDAPQYSSLPITLTNSGITAHFSATGQGYSIQSAGSMGFVPQGFGGLCIYPNSVYLADLIVDFDQPLNAFSIMFSPQELGCDDTATMRVTASMNGTYVGTSTAQAYPPGTWPTGTLTFNAAGGFNHVVVHYDQRPPTCQDYGVIFLADNMNVTALPNTGVEQPAAFRTSSWGKIKSIYGAH